ncbi:hypothetical protein CSUI_000164 [Cystoisospora suis]|uniref:Uncharacterized protein n=1 Tax=Cystoisospora suis TaxID=483139 RepID=A0A2C6LHG6_9APIC|nr:hypothetical protein CSUI_000164 [Cystoisospora suis]
MKSRDEAAGCSPLEISSVHQLLPEEWREAAIAMSSSLSRRPPPEPPSWPTSSEDESSSEPEQDLDKASVTGDHSEGPILTTDQGGFTTVVDSQWPTPQESEKDLRPTPVTVPSAVALTARRRVQHPTRTQAELGLMKRANGSQQSPPLSQGMTFPLSGGPASRSVDLSLKLYHSFFAPVLDSPSTMEAPVCQPSSAERAAAPTGDLSGGSETNVGITGSDFDADIVASSIDSHCDADKIEAESSSPSRIAPLHAAPGGASELGQGGGVGCPLEEPSVVVPSVTTKESARSLPAVLCTPIPPPPLSAEGDATESIGLAISAVLSGTSRADEQTCESIGTVCAISMTAAVQNAPCLLKTAQSHGSAERKNSQREEIGYRKERTGASTSSILATDKSCERASQKRIPGEATKGDVMESTGHLAHTDSGLSASLAAKDGAMDAVSNEESERTQMGSTAPSQGTTADRATLGTVQHLSQRPGLVEYREFTISGAVSGGAGQIEESGKPGEAQGGEAFCQWRADGEHDKRLGDASDCTELPSKAAGSRSQIQVTRQEKESGLISKAAGDGSRVIRAALHHTVVNEEPPDRATPLREESRGNEAEVSRNQGGEATRPTDGPLRLGGERSACQTIDNERSCGNIEKDSKLFTRRTVQQNLVSVRSGSGDELGIVKDAPVEGRDSEVLVGGSREWTLVDEKKRQETHGHIARGYTVLDRSHCWDRKEDQRSGDDDTIKKNAAMPPIPEGASLIQEAGFSESKTRHRGALGAVDGESVQPGGVAKDGGGQGKRKGRGEETPRTGGPSGGAAQYRILRSTGQGMRSAPVPECSPLGGGTKLADLYTDISSTVAHHAEASAAAAGRADPPPAVPMRTARDWGGTEYSTLLLTCAGARRRRGSTEPPSSRLLCVRNLSCFQREGKYRNADRRPQSGAEPEECVGHVDENLLTSEPLADLEKVADNEVVRGQENHSPGRDTGPAAGSASSRFPETDKGCKKTDEVHQSPENSSPGVKGRTGDNQQRKRRSVGDGVASGDGSGLWREGVGMSEIVTDAWAGLRVLQPTGGESVVLGRTGLAQTLRMLPRFGGGFGMRAAGRRLSDVQKELKCDGVVGKGESKEEVGLQGERVTTSESYSSLIGILESEGENHEGPAGGEGQEKWKGEKSKAKENGAGAWTGATFLKSATADSLRVWATAAHRRIVASTGWGPSTLGSRNRLGENPSKEDIDRLGDVDEGDDLLLKMLQLFARRAFLSEQKQAVDEALSELHRTRGEILDTLEKNAHKSGEDCVKDLGGNEEPEVVQPTPGASGWPRQGGSTGDTQGQGRSFEQIRKTSRESPHSRQERTDYGTAACELPRQDSSVSADRREFPPAAIRFPDSPSSTSSRRSVSSVSSCEFSRQSRAVSPSLLCHLPGTMGTTEESGKAKHLNQVPAPEELKEVGVDEGGQISSVDDLTFPPVVAELGGNGVGRGCLSNTLRSTFARQNAVVSPSKERRPISCLPSTSQRCGQARGADGEWRLESSLCVMASPENLNKRLEKEGCKLLCTGAASRPICEFETGNGCLTPASSANQGIIGQQKEDDRGRAGVVTGPCKQRERTEFDLMEGETTADDTGYPECLTSGGEAIKGLPAEDPFDDKEEDCEIGGPTFSRQGSGDTSLDWLCGDDRSLDGESSPCRAPGDDTSRRYGESGRKSTRYQSSADLRRTSPSRRALAEEKAFLMHRAFECFLVGDGRWETSHSLRIEEVQEVMRFALPFFSAEDIGSFLTSNLPQPPPRTITPADLQLRVLLPSLLSAKERALEDEKLELVAGISIAEDELFRCRVLFRRRFLDMLSRRLYLENLLTLHLNFTDFQEIARTRTSMYAAACFHIMRQQNAKLTWPVVEALCTHQILFTSWLVVQRIQHADGVCPQALLLQRRRRNYRRTASRSLQGVGLGSLTLRCQGSRLLSQPVSLQRFRGGNHGYTNLKSTRSSRSRDTARDNAVLDRQKLPKCVRTVNDSLFSGVTAYPGNPGPAAVALAAEPVGNFSQPSRNGKGHRRTVNRGAEAISERISKVASLAEPSRLRDQKLLYSRLWGSRPDGGRHGCTCCDIEWLASMSSRELESLLDQKRRQVLEAAGLLVEPVGRSKESVQIGWEREIRSSELEAEGVRRVAELVEELKDDGSLMCCRPVHKDFL